MNMIFHWWSVFIKPNMYRNGRKTVYFVTDNLRYQKLICLKSKKHKRSTAFIEKCGYLAKNPLLYVKC